jgi:hypothetical protein
MKLVDEFFLKNQLLHVRQLMYRKLSEYMMIWWQQSDSEGDKQLSVWVQKRISILNILIL